jgi:hypothetical protein
MLFWILESTVALVSAIQRSTNARKLFRSAYCTLAQSHIKTNFSNPVSLTWKIWWSIKKWNCSISHLQFHFPLRPNGLIFNYAQGHTYLNLTYRAYCIFLYGSKPLLDLDRFFSFLICTQSVELLGRGSARRKAATYTQNNTNIE